MGRPNHPAATWMEGIEMMRVQRCRSIRLAGLAIVMLMACAGRPSIAEMFPPFDPRMDDATSYVQISRLQTGIVEVLRRSGGQVDRCAFRNDVFRVKADPLSIDRWRLGIERRGSGSVLFFEARISADGKTPIAFERPTFYLLYAGPTYDWRVRPMSKAGFVRIEKDAAAISEDEQLGFMNAFRNRAPRRLAVTLPDGRGDAAFSIYDGASDAQFEMVGNCYCAMRIKQPLPLFDCKDRN